MYPEKRRKKKGISKVQINSLCGCIKLNCIFTAILLWQKSVHTDKFDLKEEFLMEQIIIKNRIKKGLLDGARIMVILMGIKKK